LGLVPRSSSISAAHSKELFDLDVLSKEYPLLWVFVLVIDHISDGTEQYFWLQYMHTLGEVSHTLISYTRPVKLV